MRQLVAVTRIPGHQLHSGLVSERIPFTLRVHDLFHDFMAGLLVLVLRLKPTIDSLICDFKRIGQCPSYSTTTTRSTVYIVPLKSSELARSDICISLAQGLQRLVPCPELSRCAMVPSLQARCDRVLSHLRLP